MKKFFKNLWCLTNGLRPVDEGTMTLLHRLNPENFTVEEVANILCVPNVWAKIVCETAVRRGSFVKIEGGYSLNEEK